MTEDAASSGRDVVLGLGAAWGFGQADQTSPALAAAAGALLDSAISDQAVTELRIHGVSGSDAPTMLEHPGALQVAGDTVTGFFRRWSPDGQGRPSVPWKLEAFSWGGLTEKPLASASWLLLAPFMMYNVAYFMLPAEDCDPGAWVMGPVPHLRRGRGHRIAGVLLRLLGLAATVQFVSAGASVVVSTVAWQAAGRPGMLPSWMGWYADWTAGWRVALALAAVVVVIAALWWVSVTTASKYEARISSTSPELDARSPLTQPGFWRGGALVGRQRRLHVAAACASAALIVALSVGGPAAVRWLAVILAVVALAAAVGSVVLPLASRHEVSLAQGGMPDKADWWCGGILAAAIAALLTVAVMSGWTDRRHGPQTGALPGLTGFLATLLVVQAALLIMLGVTVVVLTRRAPAPGGNIKASPYLGGGLGALIAALGFTLGGLLTAVISIGVTRLLATPVPSGFRFAIPSSDALAVPWPIYAFGAAPVGLLLGAAAAAVVLWRRYSGYRRVFQTPTAAGLSPVAAAYATSTAGTPGINGDDPAYARNRGAIAKAWALALITDDAPIAMALAVGGSMIVVLAAEILAAAFAGPPGHPALLAVWWNGLATLIALVGVLLAGWLVMLLRSAYSDPSRRKTIGALWDVATFWPRAVHPLAPPCYAERAVPEVVDRIRLLTGHAGHGAGDVAGLLAQAWQPDLARTSGITVPCGPVLLTGYSQGSVIAPAVIAQLPPEVLGNVALLTLACPVRRLYGRAFPAYFGQYQLDALAGQLDANSAPYKSSDPGSPGGRWLNLCRRSDYIGGWIFGAPDDCLDDVGNQVDQPCRDPVVLVPDTNPTPPPTHRHSQWWPDPRTRDLGAHLVGLLTSQPRHVLHTAPASADAGMVARSPVPNGTSSSDLVEAARAVGAYVTSVGTGVATVLAGAALPLSLVVSLGVLAVTVLTLQRPARDKSPKEPGDYWEQAAVEEAVGPVREVPFHADPYGADADSGGVALARQRYLKSQGPESVRVGEPFSLLLSVVLSDADRTGSELKPFDVPPGGRDVLLVVHAPRLRLLGPQRLTVRVPVNGDSEPVMFELRADTPGPQSVSVTAWVGGSYLGELLVAITAERDRPPGPHRDVLAEIATELTEGAVSLVVRYDPAQNAYRFEFRDEDNPDEVTSNLAYEPGPLVERLVADLDALAKGRSGYSPAQTRDYLENAGARLWNQLVPEQLREQFWDRQHRIRQLTILADKDTVPWELLYPMDPGRDAGFLVEQFPVTRAIFGWLPARTLNLRPTRFVLPEGSLPEARDEIDAMRRLLDPSQPPNEVISALTPLQDLIANGNFGLLHFACHNTYNPADGSSITLDNVQFTPTLMTTAVINRVLANSAPTIFMNACRSAGLSATYNQLDGWASQFLEAGAAAFIGSLWAVSDGAAREFAQEFYGQLQAGSSLGKAMMLARQAAADQHGDPTWLAYTAYGNPRAIISQQRP